MTKTKISKYAPKAIFAGAAEKVQERAERVQESAQNVWLAGLGALTMAEDEGGKLFKALVKRAPRSTARTRRRSRAMVKDVEARVEVVKETVVDATSGTVDKIEVRPRERHGDVLHTFGVPTRNEIRSLTKKVDALTQSVEKKAKAAPQVHVEEGAEDRGGRQLGHAVLLTG